MTGLNDSQIPHDPQQPREFHRERLSAMMDGTLSADEARFLLRRMEHDDELADCWQRWQFYGDALRGHAGRALPADFALRVGRAIAEDAEDAQRQADVLPARARRPFAYWRGVAVAASVALVAVVGTRFVLPSPQAAAVASAPAPVLPAPPAVQVPAPIRAPTDATPAAAQAAGAALVAVAASGESRKRHIVAASRALAETPAGMIPVAHANEHGVAERGTSESALAVVDPPRRPAINEGFSHPRPWPKALVPGAAGSDAIVDLHVDGGPAQATREAAFAPFEPAANAGDDAPRP